MSEFCKHYNGAGRYPACAAGIDYKEVRQANPGHGNGISLPCTPNMNEMGIACPKAEFYAPEEIEQRERESDAAIEKMMNGISPCCDAPIDERCVIPSGRHKGHGPRFCSACKKWMYSV